ncbi:Ribulose-phosphate 3-epimerase [Rhodotorula toruloides]|uniref:Ribulose-phosphate 3-epimerase n=1 Tax=Rhodotorula toruloides TaxID=5286 RepID=A0A2T0A664_RHOTO|nr:Ribulose-phosphate 3-epimerase [Rhodotorula toruloides]
MSPSSPRAIVSPSVLASNFAQLGDEIRRMMKCGAEWVHMDVMDGHFVPNITMGAPVLASVDKDVKDVFMDCHMMVSDPEKWVKPVAEAGGKSYTFHIEALADPSPELVDLIHSHSMRAAVAISPSTPSSAISTSLGQKVDMLLVMTVVPGAGGQKFMKECVPKVSELRERFPEKDIQVDGGVGPGTVGCCARAGSNVIVAGTALFGASDPKSVIDDFKKQVDEGKSVWGTEKALEGL